MNNIHNNKSTQKKIKVIYSLKGVQDKKWIEAPSYQYNLLIKKKKKS